MFECPPAPRANRRTYVDDMMETMDCLTSEKYAMAMSIVGNRTGLNGRAKMAFISNVTDFAAVGIRNKVLKCRVEDGRCVWSLHFLYYNYI